MSHIVTFRTNVTNEESAKITAQRLGYSTRHVSNYRMRDGKRVTGLAVDLPGWHKPAVFDCETGNVEFDNYSDYTEQHREVLAGRKQVGEDGRWGDIAHLNRFIDEYIATEFMREAEERGNTVTDVAWNAEEQSLQLRIQV